MILLLLITVLLFRGTFETLTEVPENKVLSSENESVVLSCHSNSGYDLSWFANGEEIWNRYYPSDAPAYISVDSVAKGTCNLKISYTDDAAQTYLCFEPGTLTKASAEVICIKSRLICNDDSTEDLVNLTCSIEFRGNWAPTMEWKEHGNQGEKVLSVNVTTITNTSVTSTLVMPVQKVWRTYTCTTKFDISGKPNATKATNVPDYTRNWTSSAFGKSQDKQASNSDVITGTTVAIAVVIVIAAAVFGIVCFIRDRRRVEKEKEQQELNEGNQERNPVENPERQEGNSCLCTSPEESTLL